MDQVIDLKQVAIINDARIWVFAEIESEALRQSLMGFVCLKGIITLVDEVETDYRTGLPSSPSYLIL